MLTCIQHSEEEPPPNSPNPPEKQTYASVAASSPPSTPRTRPQTDNGPTPKRSPAVHFDDSPDADDPFESNEPTTQSAPDLTDLDQRISALHSLTNATASTLRSLERSQSAHWDTALRSLRETSAAIASLRVEQGRLAGAVEELRVALRGGSILGGSIGSVASEAGSGVGIREGAWCGHDVRKPPRKVGRRIIGYVYEREDFRGDETKR